MTIARPVSLALGLLLVAVPTLAVTLLLLLGALIWLLSASSPLTPWGWLRMPLIVFWDAPVVAWSGVASGVLGAALLVRRAWLIHE